jgi:hypothetical protein
MGVLTGEAEERGGNYFGPALNRAARLMRHRPRWAGPRLGGRYDEAVARYEKALAVEEGFGARALAARTRYWLAKCLLEREQTGDRDRAHGVLTECITATAELRMAALERQARVLMVP